MGGQGALGATAGSEPRAPSPAAVGWDAEARTRWSSPPRTHAEAPTAYHPAVTQAPPAPPLCPHGPILPPSLPEPPNPASLLSIPRQLRCSGILRPFTACGLAESRLSSEADATSSFPKLLQTNNILHPSRLFEQHLLNLAPNISL